ncbi:uncharacterized protein CG5098 [Uranotaenia lowii]|uniref:uncharacterized protein CG5098 n=1 Tax=Uranotaenia lowii TaxID=190385 RepID=UPI00247905B8|nr:uncharacterized protein CG5098 [Uranotaenia lowii]
MSGHNPPHGRLGQPNSTWNPLQVPSYIPRQPQLAHMSSERSLARSPLTWHTPPTHQEQLYNFMTANHKNNIEINQMLPTFGRNPGMPLGSVDLSLSSATRSTPSPKGPGGHQPVPGLPLHQQQQQQQPQPSPQSQQHHSAMMPPNIPPGLGGGPQMTSDHGAPDHFNTKMSHGGPPQHHHMSTNHNRSPSGAPQIGSGVIQSTGALKERSGGNHGILPGHLASSNSPSCSFMGNNLNSSMNMGMPSVSSAGGNGYYNMMGSATGGNGTGGSSMNAGPCGPGGSNSINRSTLPPSGALGGHMGPMSGSNPPSLGMASDFAAMISAGLHVKDPKQLCNENSKNGRDNVPPNNEQSDLVKDILMHAMQSNPVSVSPKRNSPLRAPGPPIQSPTRSRSPPASVLLQSLDQPSAASVNKSYQPSASSAVPLSESGTTAPITITPTKSILPPNELSPPRLEQPAGRPSVSERTSPNQSITSNEDSGDSSSSKSRRRRKPDRTSKMGPDELGRMHDFLAGEDNSADKCDRIDGIDPMRPNIAVRSDIATLALEGISSLSQGLASDSSHSPHITDLSDSTRLNLQTLGSGPTEHLLPTEESSANKSTTVSSVISSVLSAAAAVMESTRKESESNSDDCETIDKIAAMISSTESEPIAQGGSKSEELDEKQSTDCNGPKDKATHSTEGSLQSGTEKPQLNKIENDKSYEEIENKLEEMFAGIEENIPVCSKTSNVRDKKLSSPAKQSSTDSNDILTELAEKFDGSTPLAREELGETPCDSPVPSTSGTQKKVLTPAAKRANVGKSSGPPPSKRKKVLKKKPSQTKGASFAAAEERAASFGAKCGKKPNAKGNGKKTAAKNGKSKQSDTGNGSDLNGKYRGPFIQVKSDGCHSVINAPINEDDSEKAQNKTKKYNSSMNNSERSKIRGLHVSTLSTKYDADTTDTSWMCVFCKMGPHKMRMGDLFGPYIISVKSREFEQSQTDEEYFNVKRTRESLASKFAAKPEPVVITSAPKGKKRKIANDVPAAMPGPSGIQLKMNEESAPLDLYYGMIKAGDDSYEVWMHEDCLIWAPGVHIIGTRIVGLEASIWNCCRHRCRLCSQYGAMVSCLHRGCNEEAHVICARKANWQLTDEFKSLCETHCKDDS